MDIHIYIYLKSFLAARRHRWTLARSCSIDMFLSQILHDLVAEMQWEMKNEVAEMQWEMKNEVAEKQWEMGDVEWAAVWRWVSRDMDE